MIKRFYLHIAVIILFCSLFSSCQSDEFSMDTYYTTGLCTVVVNEQSSSLLRDDGLVLIPVSSSELTGFANGKRVLVTYNVIKGSASNAISSVQIKIFDIQTIPVLDILERKELSYSIQDPVWVLSKPWISGGYLNIEFGFGHSSLQIEHTVHLVYERIEIENGKKVVYMTFGHNAKSDPTKTVSPAFVSFRMQSKRDVLEADSMIIYVHEGIKWVTYNISI